MYPTTTQLPHTEYRYTVVFKPAEEGVCGNGPGATRPRDRR